MKNRDNSSHSTESLKEHSGEICVRQSKVPDTSLHLLLGHPWNHSEQGIFWLNYSLYLDGLQRQPSVSFPPGVCLQNSIMGCRQEASGSTAIVMEANLVAMARVGCRQRRWYGPTFIQDYGLANFYINHKNQKTKQTIIRPCLGIHEGAVEIRDCKQIPFTSPGYYLHRAWCRDPRNNMRTGQGTLSFKDSVPCETMDISGTWPPFRRNKYLWSHALFLFS